MSGYFEFMSPVKVIAGTRALEQIPYELAGLGASRPMIITDKGVRGVGLIDIVESVLGAGSVEVVHIFDDVPPDSSTTVVGRIADAYRECDADALIAVGGGSVIDTAKGVNVLVSEGGDDLHAYEGTGALRRPLRPSMVIPTTAGTGSEVTVAAVIKDDETGLKIPFASVFLLPNAAILDPRMTLGLPPILTAATAMDAMTHAVESYLSLAKNPISDAYATAAIKRISECLVPTLKNPKDVDARLALSVAATMAGIAFSNATVALVHALGHTVGARCHVHHGTCMSILLPPVMRYNLVARREQIGELLLPLAGPDRYASTPSEQRAEAAVARLDELKDELYELSGLARTLSETGKVKEEDLEPIARQSLDDGALIYNPVDVGFDEALGVLRAAW